MVHSKVLLFNNSHRIWLIQSIMNEIIFQINKLKKEHNNELVFHLERSLTEFYGFFLGEYHTLYSQTTDKTGLTTNKK
jgi:Lhr-like helicase